MSSERIMNGQYGQIYAEKFTSACLICKVFYGKMKAQQGQYTRLRNKIFRKYKASGYAGVEAIFERDQRNQKFIWGMYDRICGMFCRKTR